MNHPVIKKVASTVKLSAAQVLLSWATQQNIAVIPKSSNAGRIRENFKISSDKTGQLLSESQMNEISEIKERKRIFDPTSYFKCNCFTD